MSRTEWIWLIATIVIIAGLYVASGVYLWWEIVNAPEDPEDLQESMRKLRAEGKRDGTWEPLREWEP